MTIQTDSQRFPSGLTLLRTYDDSYYPGPGSCDSQCGSLADWNAWIDQLAAGSHGYYDRPDGTNKFWEKVTLDIVSPWVPFPAQDPSTACTWNYGGPAKPETEEFARVDLQWMDPAGSANGVPNTYRFPAALSHELGHAYHDWCELFTDARLDELRKWWCMTVSSNHTDYAAGVAPWTGDKPWEQFANAMRFFFGTSVSPAATRGSSGAGTPDPVIAGFEDPAAHPEWGPMFHLLPETCAFVQAYGITPGTLSWAWGNAFRFQTAGGYWVAHWYDATPNYDVWYYWNGTAWARWSPGYTRA